MKFGTVVNCTDGRVQYPVMDYLKKHYDFDFFDSANEAGPLRTLTKNSDKCRLITLKEHSRKSRWTKSWIIFRGPLEPVSHMWGFM